MTALVGFTNGAPGPTLVIWGPALEVSRNSRHELLEAVKAIRNLDPARSAGILKHVVVFPDGEERVTVEFFQRLNDGTFDERAKVCVNSAGVAAAALRYWLPGDVSGDTELHVEMGPVSFVFHEVTG